MYVRFGSVVYVDCLFFGDWLRLGFVAVIRLEYRFIAGRFRVVRAGGGLGFR